MVSFFLLLILKIGVWWLTIDDFVEPLGVYDSTFCHAKDLIGHMNIRKAMYQYHLT